MDYIDIGDVLNCDFLQGEIVTLDDSDDTCTVKIGGDTLSAVVFYHCEPDSVLRGNGAIQDGATGFVIGDQVIVRKKKDGSDVKVIGHVNGARHCSSGTEGFCVFYKNSSGDNKAALCEFQPSGITVSETKQIDDLLMTQLPIPSGAVNPLTWHIKKFRHNVLTNGAREERDLYCIWTSAYINLAPFTGWTAFATANPSHPLVTNNLNTEIEYSAQVMADMHTVNYAVNHTHSYVSDPAGNDNWKILGEGEGGDCDDFALTKAQELLNLGYPASALHIEASLIENPVSGTRQGHAWLVVQTTNGNYALDVNSDDVAVNSALTVGGKRLYTRRRQIGNNWAFISPYSAFLSSINVYLGYYFVYIYDPLLNVIYRMPWVTPAYRPFSFPIAQMEDDSWRSSPSINFSDDHNSIYYADNGVLSTYRLDENELTLVSQTAYTEGWVTKDGEVKGPFPAEPLPGGHPYASHVPDEYLFYPEEGEAIWVVLDNNGDMSNGSSGSTGIYYIGEELVSLDGYYDFQYQYDPIITGVPDLPQIGLGGSS